MPPVTSLSVRPRVITPDAGDTANELAEGSMARLARPEHCGLFAVRRNHVE